MAGVLRDADGRRARPRSSTRPCRTRRSRRPGGGDGAAGLRQVVENALPGCGKRLRLPPSRQRSSDRRRREPSSTSSRRNRGRRRLRVRRLLDRLRRRDPVALMKKHAGASGSPTLKDMPKASPGAPAARREESKVVLGTGGLDIKGILAAARRGRRDAHHRGRERRPGRPDPEERRLLPRAVATGRRRTRRARSSSG